MIEPTEEQIQREMKEAERIRDIGEVDSCGPNTLDEDVVMDAKRKMELAMATEFARIRVQERERSWYRITEEIATYLEARGFFEAVESLREQASLIKDKWDGKR